MTLFLEAIAYFLAGYILGRLYAQNLAKRANSKTNLTNKLNRAVAQNPKPSLEN